MSDSSDTNVSPVLNKGKRKAAVFSDSMRESDSSDVEEFNVVKRSGKRKARIRESDSDSSIENCKIKRVPRVASDSEGSSSDDTDIIQTRRISRNRRVVLSDDDSLNQSDSINQSDSSDLSDVGFEDNSSSSDDWESDWVSDSEPTLAAVVEPPQVQNNTQTGNYSDSSDGESEKCPICLLSFNQQEVGTPETCDHSFCAECIQEWSKNVNTCPVDRQTFTLILVRKRYNGKVIRRVPVDVRRLSEDELIQEDPTYCEICGMSDREDRLLLCDGCDLGYHLECLDPPMSTVPVEEWFCGICRDGRTSQEQHHQEQHRNEPRLLPRTSQSERIRATIETNRISYSAHQDQQSISSGFEDVSMPGTSNSSRSRSRNNAQRTQTTTATRKKKKNKRRKRRVQYNITYEICETTGEKVAIKTRKKTRRKARRRKRKSQRRLIKPKTVKKRLAFQLGMCPPKTAGLSVPEVKVKSNSSTTGNIGYQRTQAGIPTLHLFGQRDDLDYFSGSDEEISAAEGSARVLTQSRGHHFSGGMSAMRRAARRKAAVLSPTPAVSVNSCDILGSILDSQAKLHSKHSKLSVTRDGTIRIENDRIIANNTNSDTTNEILTNNNNPPLDLTSKNELETTQAPMFPGRGGANNRQPYGFNRGGYRSNNENRYDNNHPGGNYFQSGGNRGRGSNYGFGNQRDNFPGGNYMNFHHHGGPPPFRGRGSPRFPQRRPQFAHQQPQQQHPHPQNEAQHQFREEEDEITQEAVEPVDLVLDDANDQNETSRLQEPEDVDIYSDIEDSVQTQDEEEVQVKPPPSPVVEGPPIQGLVAYNNSDDDDSGSELIIDDTKEDKNETAQTDEIVTDLTVIPDKKEEQEEKPTENRQYSQQVVKQVVEEVLQEHLNTPVKKTNEYDDDELSNDDCPNFSIYSSTSIDIAKSTDFSVDIPHEAENMENTSRNMEKTPEKLKSAENTEAQIEIDDKKEDEDDWPSGDDEWDTCDAENAQKSWDQPYEPPEESTEVSGEKPTEETTKIPEEKLLKETPVEENFTEEPPTEENLSNEVNQQKELIPEASNNKTEDSDSDEYPENESTTENNKKRSPSPDLEPEPDSVSILQKSEQNIISESLTPPLPSSTTPITNQRPQEKTAAPIKIAFNPNTRKLQKTTPFAEKEKVIQLYDDSDYEEWELKNDEKTSTKPEGELEKLTEAISEEERSYTPCLDEKDPTKPHSEEEKNIGAGIGGMDTEMISDDERNEFDESHDMKTISDGDALEINAKESELELARPEDYEEGEIVEKAGAKQPETKPDTTQPEKPAKTISEDEKKKRPKKKPSEKEPEKEKSENEKTSGKKSEFKKISKSNKERNYRDKERSKSKEHAKGKENRETNAKEELRKKKERKRDLERYNVRSIIADKPKKDQFGRDIKSASRSSRSATPRRSRSHSWNRAKKRRRRSRSPRRSRSRSHSPRSRSRGRSARRSRSFRRSKSPRRSRSRSFRRSRTPKNKRHREVKSLSRERDRVRYRNRSRRSADRTQRKKKNRSTSRNRMRSRSPSPVKHRLRNNEWPRQGDTYTREWTPSWSRSPTPPRPIPRHNLPQSMSPSWTPPIAIEKGPVQPENLTVILNNDVNKSKKKEKRKKADKKSRDEFRKRKRVDRTPPPSKEVFASGDNILVSVSFNKTNEESTIQREVMGVKRKRDSVSDTSKKKKEKNGEKKKKRAKSPRTKKKNKEIANLKPVAIIDLDRSPFKELTPSPKDIIVLSDSDNCEKEDEAMMVHHHEMLQEELMALGAQIQEDSAPQSPNNYLNTTGPKTPPEPQIKFLLTSKQSQLRAINNPLHDPNDEGDPEIDPQEELEHRLDDILHKGPNTPPEPPSSPPSSPDAYDPFDPTKSRSPTPEPTQNQPVLNTPGDTKESENDMVDLAADPLESTQTCSLNDSTEKQISSTSPERPQTRTPPIINSEQIKTTENENKNDPTEKSPERNPIGVIINQQVQPAVVKPIIPTSSPSVISTSLPRTSLFNTSAPVGAAPRIATSVPQRIILPTPSKSSPAKMSPLKTSPSKPPIKSTPIKPMPSKTMISKLPVPNMKPLTPIRKGPPPKPVNRNVGQNGNEIIDVDLDFDSPYSPGSSDYEDLFEPPAETVKTGTRQKNTKSPAKQNAFDNLFGSSPVFRKTNNKSKTNAAKIPVKMNKKTANTKTNSKTIGVKIDEDNLKILDDLPNSAVEMQVKDKFLKKLNRQERVVEEVKLVLKPHYNKKHVTKEQYKDILRRAVPKICHNRSGEINPKKIQNLIEAYVKKARHARKPANPSNPGANSVAQQPKPYREITLKRNYFI